MIIFSDKRCAYGSSDDANRDWSRWYKRAIKKPHDQLRGALRWLRQYPNRVFLDAGCKQPLPIGLPTGDSARYHLVVVASGAKTACQTSMNGSGSLCIAPSVNTAERPFFVGDIGGDSEYVHVLDEVTIQTLLNELDTVSDFVAYLNAKESLLRSGKVEAVYGEENLLSLYVNSTIDGEHGFADPDTSVYVQDGLWKEHFNSERAQAKMAAYQISYAWDELIEHYVRHFNAGTLLNDNSPEYADFETGIRVMAKESLMNRRMVANAWVDWISNAPSEQIAIRRWYSCDTRVVYVFLSMPRESEDSMSSYVEYRSGYLSNFVQSVPAMNPDCRWVVGIGTEPTIDPSRPRDLVVFDATKMSDDDWAAARDIHEQMKGNRIGQPTPRVVEGHEYPKHTHPQGFAIRKVPRNSPCVCGSGKKFKKCHGRPT